MEELLLVKTFLLMGQTLAESGLLNPHDEKKKKS